MDVAIVIEAEELERASVFVETFGRKATPGVRQAINRALAGVKTDAARLLRMEYTVKAKDIKKTFRISKAGRLMVGKATSSGYQIPLHQFGGLPKRPRYPRKFPSITGRKVTVAVKKNRKVLKKVDGNYPFVAIMPSSGHIGIFRRSPDRMMEGRDKQAIDKLLGPSIPSMMSSDSNRIKDELQTGAQVRFEKNLDHAINRVFQQAGI